MPDQNQYIVPNRAKPLTVVASSPINENWELIQEAINKNYNLASEVDNKIDVSEKGVQGGVATLNIDSKLETSQLPEEAKGHVFKVKSLAAQLSLEAFSGDICVREDTGKTYALSTNAPGSFSNWIEVASIHSGGDLGGNPTYTADILETDWQEDIPSQTYSLTYEDSEHGQGQTNFLLVDVKDKIGRSIDCEIVIDSNGTVTITSKVNFQGYVIISNLLGNCTNLKAVPYSILKGYRSNGNPDFINYSLHTISLITEPPITIIDGMDLLQNITSSDNLILPDDILDGEYILFIDSANIVKGHLKSLSYCKKSDYLGIVDVVPNKGKENQRCYVAYDKSYEYKDSGWRNKAFTPIGEFIASEGIVIATTTYAFNQNGITINYKSHELDYLFGSKIEGLENQISENQLSLSGGRCLVGNIVITLKNNLVKTLDIWEEGYQAGCIDPLSNYHITTAYEVTKENQIYYVSEEATINSYVEAGTTIYTDPELQVILGVADEFEYLYNGKTHINKKLNTGWGNIFLIANRQKQQKIDLLIAFIDEPILPIGFNIYRKIGYVYRDIHGKFLAQREFNKKVYFPTPITVSASLKNEITELPIALPLGTDLTLSYSLKTPQNVTFYVDSVEIYKSSSLSNTLDLPNYNNSIAFKGDSMDEITFKFYGYIDRSLL